jgi:hypothetical protein
MPYPLSLIHPKLIKETAIRISKPVTKIFNKSMEEKKLPKIWKIANNPFLS